MKFTKTEGCTAFSEMIGDQRLSDMTDAQILTIRTYLIGKIRDNKDIGIFDLVSLFPIEDFEYSKEPCDQCGDSTSTTTWEI